MSFALCYWIMMLIWLVFGFWANGFANPKIFGGTLMLFLLLVLIGWKVFGAPLHS